MASHTYVEPPAPAGLLEESACPSAKFFCVCGHGEDVHSIEHLEELSEGFVEHWECRLCPCLDFEVAS